MKTINRLLMGLVVGMLLENSSLAQDSSLQSDGVVLNLNNRVEAYREGIRLKDLLASSTSSSYGEIPVGLSPSLGEEKVFLRADLDGRLRNLIPDGQWTWVGAEKCVVTRPSREIQETELVEMIESQLRQFTEKVGEIHVLKILGFSPVSIPREGSIPQLELVSPNGSTRFGGAMLDVEYQGKSVVRRNMRFEWEWKKPVWVAQNNVRSGNFSSYDFNMETRDVLTLRGDPMGMDEMKEGLALVRSMSKGEVLMNSNIKTMLAVTSGSPVVANMHVGALLVSLKAVALENGVIGQNIKIQNPTSRKELTGRVVENHTVEVIP